MHMLLEKWKYYSLKMGTTWKSLSSLAIPGNSTQNITFISPITTRYLKYQIITISTNGRTDVTVFNVYEPKSE